MANIKLHTYHTMGNPGLEAAWRKMEREDDSLSPFLYFDYLRNVFLYTLRWAWVWSPLIACAESSDGEILMIAPIKRNRCNGTVRMLGDIKGCGHTGLLFKRHLSDDEKNECVRLFLGNMRHKMKLRRICGHSWLRAYIEKHETDVGTDRCECVRLCFTGDIDLHIKGLSPSVRQNLRTAYNRVRRDCVSMELRVYMPGDAMDAGIRKAMMRIYLRRFLGKYKKDKSGNALYKAYKTAYYKHIKHDSISLRTLDNTFHSVLFLNGGIACFMSGFLNHGCTRVVIPRLAFNDKYKFYSPGYILICDTMRWLASNSGICEIDLVRGVERYKTDLGGEIYNTYSYTLAPRRAACTKKQ